MHEGQRLEALLKEHGKNQAALARVLGVSTAAVTKYVKMQTIGPGAFESVRRGLEALGIDPAKLRSSAGSSSLEEVVVDLRHCLKGMNKQQLENVKTILDAGQRSRDQLRMVIVDRIERE